MNGGVKVTLLLSSVALAGCSTVGKPTEFRPIADPSAALRNGGDAIAVARGQFLLGNVGLALEAFRKAQRDNPNDPAAISGIGDCYAAMGRYDLAESNYEMALALAPRDHVLLLGLASVLERSGDAHRAANIRDEAARFEQTAALLAAQARARQAALARSAEAPRTIESAAGSVTVALPPARPAVQSPAKALAPRETPKQVAAVERAAPAKPLVVAAAAVPVANPLELSAAVAAVAPLKIVEASAPAPVAHVQGARIIGAVPPPASAPTAAPQQPKQLAAPVSPGPVTPLPIRNAAVAEASAAPTSAPKPPFAEVRSPGSWAPGPPPPIPPRREPPALAPAAIVERSSPRLERLDRGVVALVTRGDPVWRAPEPMRTASADGVRWVPLPLSRATAVVQVLNGARKQGIAAHARSVLVGRGWRSIAIGDSKQVRRTSVVFYPKERASLGRRLAKQFGVEARLADRDNVVLVLGRDLAGKVAGRQSS